MATTTDTDTREQGSRGQKWPTTTDTREQKSRGKQNSTHCTLINCVDFKNYV